MSTDQSQHRRPRQTGAAVVATLALAAGILPLAAGGTASAAVLLPPPAVASPLTEETVLKEVVLDWAAMAGATGYVVQIGTDELWSDDPTMQLTTVATRLTVPTSLPHAGYVWRVAAVGAGGQGRWSANGSFTRAWGSTPLPIAPSGAIASEVGVPTFSWTPVPTASEYQVQVSTTPFFDAPFRTQSGDATESCFTTRTSITPFNSQGTARLPGGGAGDCVFQLLLTGEQRYWRVRALDHVVDGAPEVNTTPVVDEGISSQPPQRGDELVTDACPSSPKPFDPSTGTGTSPSPSPSPTASQAPGATGSDCTPGHTVEKGVWSTSTAFSHALPAAPAPVPFYGDLGAPEVSLDGCVIGVSSACRDFPTVTWTDVPGAQWYRLYVALDPAFDNVHEIVETPAKTWTPTHQWRESTLSGAYYVAVQACTTSPTASGAAPGCAAPGPAVRFKKSSPAVALVSPADGARTGGGEQVLTWRPFSQALATATGRAATSEAYAYRVQVSTSANPDFLAAGLVEDVTVDATHHVSATKTYGNGELLWRVQAVDASGHRLPWSLIRSFTRDAVAPTFTVTPAKLSITGPVRVSFSEPVSGISSGSVSLTGVPASLLVAADRRSATLTPTSRLVPGARVTTVVTAAVKDLAGNPVLARSVVLGVNPLVDDRSPAIAYAGSWTRLSSSNAVAMTWSRSVPTTRARTFATVSLVGRSVEIKGCVGPANGIVEVWADGALLRRLDTYRSSSACGVVLTRASFAVTKAVHSVQLRGTGLKNAVSKGTAVGVDAITVIP